MIYNNNNNTAYYSHCPREAIGAILRNPNKPDYSIPKSNRPVSLLNCLFKVSDNMMASRLSYLAEAQNMLYNDQLGGRQGRSSVHAVLALVYDMHQANYNCKVLSALFVYVNQSYKIIP